MRRRTKKLISNEDKELISDLSSLMTDEIDAIIKNLQDAKQHMLNMHRLKTTSFMSCRKLILESRNALTTMSKTILETRKIFTEERN